MEARGGRNGSPDQVVVDSPFAVGNSSPITRYVVAPLAVPIADAVLIVSYPKGIVIVRGSPFATGMADQDRAAMDQSNEGFGRRTFCKRSQHPRPNRQLEDPRSRQRGRWHPVDGGRKQTR
jgi:hypothetical protein